jgi:hypothetical protein
MNTKENKSVLQKTIEFKGTKGKWFIDNEESHIMSNYVYCNVISTKNTIGLADIYGNDEQGKANALLISKAPEMLEMLDYLSTRLGTAFEREIQEINQLIKEATEL